MGAGDGPTQPLASVTNRPHLKEMPDSSLTPDRIARTRWREVILVCRKCQKKLDKKTDGGFGPDGDQTLRKALKRYLKPEFRVGKGRKAEIAVLQTGCLDICPKGAVAAVNAARPEAVQILAPGVDLLTLRRRLGLPVRRPPAERDEAGGEPGDGAVDETLAKA